MSGIRLTDSEKLALKWLAQEFPIGSSWENKLVHWSVITEGLSKVANIVDDTACDQTIRRFRELDLFEIDVEATKAERRRICAKRVGWLSEDPEQVAARFRSHELDVLDLVRQYGVILDWGSGELLTKTTAPYREMLQRRPVAGWLPVTGDAV